MTEQYKNQIDKIHAPETLIIKTQEKISQRKRMRKMWRGVSVAAVLVFFLGIAFWYGQRNYTSVNVQQLAFENDIKAGINAGVKDQTESDISSEEYLAVGDNLHKAKKIMEQITPSIIKGQEVYVGYEAKTATFYAVHQQDGKTYLIANDEKTEEKFISFLKKIM